MFLSFLCFWLVILLFKLYPSYSAEVLSRFPQCKKAGVCLTEEMRVLDKLCSGMSFSAMAVSLILMN